MGNIRCPHCGSKDCKERVITPGKIADMALSFGVEAVKSLFTGKMNYQEAVNSYNQDAAFKSGLKNKKRSFRCKACGHTWESRH